MSKEPKYRIVIIPEEPQEEETSGGLGDFLASMLRFLLILSIGLVLIGRLTQERPPICSPEAEAQECA